MTDKRKTQLKESQQTYRDKQKKRKPLIEDLKKTTEALANKALDIIKQLDEV